MVAKGEFKWSGGFGGFMGKKLCSLVTKMESYQVSEVRLDSLRIMVSRLLSVWVQRPLAATNRIASVG